MIKNIFIMVSTIAMPHPHAMKLNNKSHNYHNITNILEDKEGRTLFSSDQYRV